MTANTNYYLLQPFDLYVKWWSHVYFQYWDYAAYRVLNKLWVRTLFYAFLMFFIKHESSLNVIFPKECHSSPVLKRFCNKSRVYYISFYFNIKATLFPIKTILSVPLIPNSIIVTDTRNRMRNERRTGRFLAESQ